MNEKVCRCQWCGEILNGVDDALASYCDKSCRDAEMDYCSCESDYNYGFDDDIW